MSVRRAKISWVSIVLGSLFIGFAFACIYVYYLMRQITLSTERFEIIPSYIIALQLFVCGVIQFLLARSTFREQRTAVRFAAMIFGISLLLLVVGLVSVLWLAEKQDSFTVCVLNPQLRKCSCRRDNETTADYGWYVYDRMRNCRNLDKLFHLMIATMVLYASAAFSSFLSILYLYVLWAAVSQGSDRRAAAGRTERQQRPITDWDSFLFNNATLRRMLAELRHQCFPPTYDDSERQVRRETRRAQRSHEPPPPYTEQETETDEGPAKVHVTVVQVTQ